MGSLVVSKGEPTHVFTMVSLVPDDAAVELAVAMVVEVDAVGDEVLEASGGNVVSLDEVEDEHEASTDTNTSAVNGRRNDDVVVLIVSFG